MQPTEYMQAALRTAAGTVHPQICPKYLVTEAMLAVVAGAAEAAAVKKGYWYGKPTPKLAEMRRHVGIGSDSVADQTLHGIVGIATEAAELAALVVEADDNGHPIAREDIVDEAGDLMWYLAVLLEDNDITFEEVMTKNIAKLKARFPQRFSLEAWEARDKGAELAAQQAVN